MAAGSDSDDTEVGTKKQPRRSALAFARLHGRHRAMQLTAAESKKRGQGKGMGSVTWRLFPLMPRGKQVNVNGRRKLTTAGE